jgi:alkylhydroperoxidase family enzyme
VWQSLVWSAGIVLVFFPAPPLSQRDRVKARGRAVSGRRAGHILEAAGVIHMELQPLSANGSDRWGWKASFTTEKEPNAMHLAPKEPNGLKLKLLSWFVHRQFGKLPGWLTVFSTRMPFAFTSWMGKAYQLNQKLELSQDTAMLIREHVASTNMCTFCMDATRYFATTKAPHNLAKFDALHEYQTSPLFDGKERAALDFATELTEQKHVSPDTFNAASHYYSEREICEIVWVVSSEHLVNINNLGLGIGSDRLCEVNAGQQSVSSEPSARRG